MTYAASRRKLSTYCGKQLYSANTRNSLRDHLNVFDPTGGRGNRRAVFAHTLEMEFDRLPNGGFRLCECAASRYTTGQIRNVSRIVVTGGFNNDCIAHEIDLTSSNPTASGYC